ncbi:MAG: ABC transporter ATP-binding protein [Erysipelotrichaceae bacterium]|nr:ABC transporter ATP-binding protein [Erysipelotrichaceae bacterium]
MSDIEDKIKKDVADSIKTQKEDKINAKILKKQLFEFAPSLKNKMTFSIVLACFGESLGFVSFFFGVYAANNLLSGNYDFWQTLIYGLLALLLLILQRLLTCLSSIKSHYISFMIMKNIRMALSEKLEKVSLGYVMDKPIGYYKALIVERVGSLEDWVAHVMPELPSRLLHPILATLILFIIDYRLGLACFISIPFIIIAMSFMMYKREERMYIWLNSNQELNARTIEYVNGISVIKAFGQANNSYEKFTAAVNYYHSSTLAWWKNSWLSMALLTAIISSPLIGTLPIGFYLYSTGSINIVKLISGLILPLSILPNVFALVMSFELYQMIETSWRMIKSVMSLPEMIRPNTEVLLDENKNFEFDNVSFEYDKDVEVLHDLNFEILNNKVTAIVGESGSGKSTIAKLMVGFFDANKGKIKYGGIDVKDIPTNQLMNEISYVAQDNFLFDASVKENLKLAKPNASDEEILKALSLASCDELISRLPKGIESNAGDCGKFLSGGERQRLTLARAILADRKCIILDEATAYADPENETKIQDALNALIKDKTLIVVAHRLNTIVDADQIIVLDKGSIAAIGKHHDLINTCDIYKNLWRSYKGEEVEA